MKKTKIMRVPYAGPVYGKPEIQAVVDVLKNPLKIVSGTRVKEFESKIAKLFGKKYGVMVNSGSSANLISVEVLNLPEGSEVITPILTFSTTLAPLLQKKLVPVFADVEPGSYVINVGQIEKLITKKTKALMIPSLLGNLPDMERLAHIARKYDLWFIEDSCDTLGGVFAGKPSGAYSDIATTSFYASHIITAAGGGGMACFNDSALARRALVMSNWGRESTLFGVYEKSEDIKKRFASKLAGGLYDAKFIFSEVGYNFQSTEINAAFGSEQLKRLDAFARRRKENFNALFNFFQKYEEFFILPRTHAKARTNWLAFPLTIREGAGFTRHALTKYLEENNIQTRPIFTGNVLKQPAFARIAKKRTLPAGYPIADFIMRNGFVIGCHQALIAKQLMYVKNTFKDFLSQFSH